MADIAPTSASALVTFTFCTQQLRVVMRDDEPWFVAADVCAALDIVNSRDAMSRLDDDEKGVVSTDTLGGTQDMNVVNEPGLYTLVLGSRKPEAKKFKRWVTHEVLPAIRKTGSYVHAPAVRPTLTNEQKRALAAAVKNVVCGWVFNEGDLQYVYNHLRVAFQVASVHDIPADSFDAALALVESKKTSVNQFLGVMVELNTWFGREVLGGATPWTPDIGRRVSRQLVQRVTQPANVDWLALARSISRGQK